MKISKNVQVEEPGGDENVMKFQLSNDEMKFVYTK
jgi:hypothetical protein